MLHAGTQSLVELVLAQKLFRQAVPPAEWDLSAEKFQLVLERCAAHHFSKAARSTAQVETFLGSLQLSDLALATACAEGNSAAWDFFVANFRPELYRAARAICSGRGEADARDLADSLYAELYGLRESEGRRKSLFEYFHGRSSLKTWLRAILSQRLVDQFRRTQREDPLEVESTNGETKRVERSPVTSPAAPDPDREALLAAVQATLVAVLNALDPRDRLRLAYYYVNELTLAQIGRLLGEHESSVSRKLDRTRSALREDIERTLRDGKKLTEAQLRQCFDYAREEWPFDLTAALSQPQESRVQDFSAAPFKER